MYELNVRREGVGGCPKCGTESVIETSERIHTAVGLPMLRRVYQSSTCPKCRWWWGKPIKRPDHPRTAGARPLIVLTWLLALGACLAVIPYKLQRDRLDAKYAAAPLKGDIWDVDLSEVPDGESGYTQARVDRVDELDVQVSLCGYKYERSQDSDKCDSFPHKLDPMPRVEVVRLLETDAIRGIERDGDGFVRFKYFSVWLLGVLGLFVVHARRSRRVLG